MGRHAPDTAPLPPLGRAALEVASVAGKQDPGRSGRAASTASSTAVLRRADGHGRVGAKATRRAGSIGNHRMPCASHGRLGGPATDPYRGGRVERAQKDGCQSQAAGRAWPGVSSGDGGTVRRAAGSKRVPRKFFSRRETVDREGPEERGRLQARTGPGRAGRQSSWDIRGVTSRRCSQDILP